MHRPLNSTIMPFGSHHVLISAFFAFLHFFAVFGIVSAVFFQWFTMSKAPSCIEAKRIQLCDRWYGVFSVVLLVVGFLRVLYFEKGKDFYFSSPFFRLKLALFLVLGLLSIYPTVKFISWRKETSLEKPPIIPERQYTAISRILNLELLVLLAIALCASLMARGLGL
jgi:putative membrane protein